jgi:chromosome segregation ATPase
MIKIFSIKEIINASEKILNESKKNNNNPIIINETNKKNYIKPLILESEIHKNNFTSKEKKKIKKTNSINLENESNNNLQIVDQLFKLFNKKIKKSTLKIIIEQQKEIEKLKKDLSEIRKKDYRSLKINKELKNKIGDLENNEKILNFKISQIHKKLNISLSNEDQLQITNEKLKVDIFEMKKSLNDINEIGNHLKKTNLKLQKKIDDLIIDNERASNINKTNENNVLVLTNTKNHLFNEIENLKEELKIINENKNILIFNNEKIQKENRLLLKNKELLIEINDKYQNQVSELELNKKVFLDEKLTLNNNITLLTDLNEKILHKSEIIHEENTNLQKKINLSSYEKNELLKDNKKNISEKNIIEKKFSLLIAEKQKVSEKNEELTKQISNYIISENSLLEKYKILEDKNNKETPTLTNNDNALIDLNKKLKIEIISLKNTEQNLIENNKKLNNELLQIKMPQNSLSQEKELHNLKEKLNFHQDENLRLSHDLSNSQKKYKLIKDQLLEIEKEKSNISRKIDDLTDSLSKTKVVTNIFDNKSDGKININTENKIDLDLNEEIDKIFNNKI